MCLLVVDPYLLLRGLEDQHSQEAKLLSLLIYGLASVRAQALREECHALHHTYRSCVSPQDLAKLRACVDRRRAAAHRQRRQIERALDQHVPTELLLVTSAPLRQELRDLAQAAQRSGNSYIHPQRVNREIARCTWRTVTEVESHPFGLSPRDYLIHTAVVAGTQTLITDDDDVALSAHAGPYNAHTRRRANPYTLDEFCQEQLPSQLDFDAIDPPAVFRAARDTSPQAS